MGGQCENGNVNAKESGVGTRSTDPETSRGVPIRRSDFGKTCARMHVYRVKTPAISLHCVDHLSIWSGSRIVNFDPAPSSEAT